jgi:hypothetical protein
LGLFCVWDNGSYDSNDDPGTGNKSACEDQNGGTWFNGSPSIWDQNAGDWSNQASAEFAGWAQGINPSVGDFGDPSGTADASVFGTSTPVAANNESWAWTFTKSFYTFAGGPGNVPTCAGQALRHIGEILNPFVPGASTAAEAVAPVAQAVAINQGVAQTQAGIDAYVAARGLTVPLRSSVVRAMAAEGAEGTVAAGSRANLAVQTLAVDYAAINSTITTAGEARNGQCAAAFPIF